jgi:hexosaminidase
MKRTRIQNFASRDRDDTMPTILSARIPASLAGISLMFCMLTTASGTLAQAAPSQAPALMPLPRQIQMGASIIPLGSGFSITQSGYTEPRLDRATQRFQIALSRKTGIPLVPLPQNPARVPFSIHTGHASDPVQRLGEDESYALEVNDSGVTLNAPTPLGAMHGLQTLLQLVILTPQGFAIPQASIQDTPRFPWRGLMIDTSRHFIPLDVIRRNLDGMERVKLNVFHWHLSDNQGFRVESKRFPKLQEQGSDGLFYTQEEIRGIIAYAHDRGIRVVPEFDVPGHSTAWFVGYPELASASGPYEIERRWGIFDPAIDPTNENSYRFLDELFGEMTKLFPDQFFHVGGDEVNGKQWDANPKIQQYMRQHNIKDNAALQAYFNKRLQPIVAKHGKTMIGWDEVLDPSLPKDITIQSWRGAASLAEAAKGGYRGLLSSGWYLDLGWSAARHYAVDPMDESAASLTDEQRQRILGGEACMWMEYADAETVDSRIWPRTAAIAERLWSPRELRDTASMYRRLDVVSHDLEFLGLTHNSYYEPMLQRIAGPASPEQHAALRTLADVVEPVKNYDRQKTRTYEPTSATPLTRVVDAVHLESDAGRLFSDAVDAYLHSSCRDTNLAMQLRKQLSAWTANDATFQTLAQQSSFAQEAAASSKDLSAIGQAGLAALDYLEKGQAAPGDFKPQQAEIVQRTSEPKGQLLLIPAPAVGKLIDGAATSGACAAK